MKNELTRIWFGVQLAFDTLRAHKLRAFLTVLGVILGELATGILTWIIVTRRAGKEA